MVRTIQTTVYVGTISCLLGLVLVFQNAGWVDGARDKLDYLRNGLLGGNKDFSSRLPLPVMTQNWGDWAQIRYHDGNQPTVNQSEL